MKKQQQIKFAPVQKSQPKQIKVKVRKLPKLQKSAGVNEEHVSEYMKVLRKTNREIGLAQLESTLAKKAQAKEDKKFKNPNFLKEKLTKPAKNHAVRRKIKAMREQRVFPQPKSYMNHRKVKGILKKNSIKTFEDCFASFWVARCEFREQT